jgi:small subunit ribosomal protein S9
MDTIHKIGRRKTSIARVYLKSGSGAMMVNAKDYKTYFPTMRHQNVVNQAQEIINAAGLFDVVANVEGGGITGQAEAIRLAIARALVEANPENKPALKAKGLLTRDPRMVERKKPGQKKARKRFQFSKR